MKHKRQNPRKRPATFQDVKRSAQEGSDRGVKLALAICLMVMKDDFDFTNDQIEHAYERMTKLSGEVAEKRISVNDLIQTLDEEYAINLR